MISNNNITQQQKSAGEDRRGETYEHDFCPPRSPFLNLDLMGSISHAKTYAASDKASTQKIDAIQATVERMPQVELPLTHRFTPGMYIRTIFMPRGALVISRIHRTQHPFVVTKGHCLVWDMAGGAATIKAGHIGITMPGTRRILYIYEDTEWTTFHATDKTTPEEVEADIIEPHDFDRAEALALFAQLHGQLTERPDGAQDSSTGQVRLLEHAALGKVTQDSAADCDLPGIGLRVTTGASTAINPGSNFQRFNPLTNP